MPLSCSASVFFPQTCSHMVHVYNRREELITALITGGDRLVILRQGVCIAASEPLTRPARVEPGRAHISSVPEVTPAVQCVCLCPFSNDVIRVIVATTDGIRLYELDDSDPEWGGITTRTGGDPVGDAEVTAARADPPEKQQSWLRMHGSGGTLAGGGTAASCASDGWRTDNGKLMCRDISLLPIRCSPLYTSALSPPPNNVPGGVHRLERCEPALSHAGGAAGAATAVPLVSVSSGGSRVVVAAEFVSELLLCLVLRGEAMLVRLAARTLQSKDMDCHSAAAQHAEGATTLGGTRPLRPTTSVEAFMDQIVWYSVEDYSAVAVCNVNRHMAFALRSSAITVFPFVGGGTDGITTESVLESVGVGGGLPGGDDVTASTIGSPCSLQWPAGGAERYPASAGGQASCALPVSLYPLTANPKGGTGKRAAFAGSGISVFLGAYDVRRLEWHQASSHTLLCVICLHRHDCKEYLLLYTLQRVYGVKRYTNVYDSSGDGVSALCMASDAPSGGTADGLVQLTPSGIVALTTIAWGHPLGGTVPDPYDTRSAVSERSSYNGPSGEPSSREATAVSSPSAWLEVSPDGVFTGMVPWRSYASHHTTDDTLEWLHVEPDGTVRTSSYQFGWQKHTSFAKQRATGLTCFKLLLPLLEMYGALDKASVLPAPRNRPIEFGASSPHTALMVSVRRYRFVAAFLSGLVALVMVDLSAAVYRVESFLALGHFPILCLVPVDLPPGWQGPRMTFVAGMLGPPVRPGGSGGMTPIDAERQVDGMAALRRSCHGVVMFTHRIACDGSTRTKVLVVAPLRVDTTRVDAVQASFSSPVGLSAALPSATASVPPSGPDVLLANEDGMTKVILFMENKCPEKVKMAPALLKACGGDAERLLIQLTAKYGTLAKEDAVTPPHGTTFPEGAASPEEFAAHPTVRRGYADDARLCCGHITSAGVSLYVSSTQPLLRSGDVPLSDTPLSRTSDYLLALPSVDLEWLAPVQSSLPSGGVPLTLSCYAEVLPLPPETEWWTACGYAERLTAGANAVIGEVDLRPMWGAHCRVLAGAVPTLEVYAPLLPPAHCPIRIAVEAPTSSAEDASVRHPRSAVRVLSAQVQQLANNDIVVGALVEMVCGATGEMEAKLLLYGLPAAQSLKDYEALRFELEHVLGSVSHFWIGQLGEVLVVREGRSVTRWLRCFPSAEVNTSACVHYVLDGQWTGYTVLPSEIFTAFQVLSTGQHIYATTRCDYVHMTKRHVGASHLSGRDGLILTPVPPYHPDSVMQLIGSGRWGVLFQTMAQLADELMAFTDAMAEGRDTVSALHLIPTAVHDLCYSSVAKGFRDRPLLPLGENVPHFTPAAGTLSHGVPQPSERTALAAETPFTEVFADADVLKTMAIHLPRVQIEGLTSMEQLGLLCIVEALHATSQLAQSVDEAAARFFFLYRLTALRRRVGLAVPARAGQPTTSSVVAVGVPSSSVLAFATGNTAGRTIATASFFWAALSDSHSVLLSELIGDSFLQGTPGALLPGGAMGGHATVTFDKVERLGAPYWVASVKHLQTLAELIARAQYKATRSVQESALMFCVAKRVGTLATLCKSQNNKNLHAFFSRDFSTERNRQAASANAFEAIRKNMPLYGACFFLLAGDVRSAVQVILQRHGNTSLALFVLRAAGDGGKVSSDMTWFAEQCQREGPSYALDMWELACLKWLSGDVTERVAALQALSAHPTGHPEVLCILRYARSRVSALAHRGMQFLTPEREVICLLRVGRFCYARGLLHSAALHYQDATCLLKQMQRPCVSEAAGKPSSTVDGSRRPTRTHMQANYNMGTLAFTSFDMESDDDSAASYAGADEASGAAIPGETECPLSMPSLGIAAGVPAKGLGPGIDAVEGEIRHMEMSMVMLTNASEVPSCSSHATLYETTLFVRVASLWLCATQGAPLEEVEHGVSRLLAYVQPVLMGLRWEHTRTCGGCNQPFCECQPNSNQQGTSVTATEVLLVTTLRIALATIATYTRNYLVAQALLHVPACVQTLQRGICTTAPCEGSEPTTIHPVVAFLAAVLDEIRRQHDHLRSEEEREQGEATQKAVDTMMDASGNVATDATAHRSVCATLLASAAASTNPAVASSPSTAMLSEPDLVASLFCWFALSEHHLAIVQLRGVKSFQPQRAFAVGESIEVDDFLRRHPLPFHVLLNAVLTHSTLRWHVLSSDVFIPLRSNSQGVARDWGANPNGSLVEAERALRHTLVNLQCAVAHIISDMDRRETGRPCARSASVSHVCPHTSPRETSPAAPKCDLDSTLLHDLCHALVAVFRDGPVHPGLVRLVADTDAFIDVLRSGSSPHLAARRLWMLLKGVGFACQDTTEAQGDDTVSPSATVVAGLVVAPCIPSHIHEVVAPPATANADRSSPSSCLSSPLFGIPTTHSRGIHLHDRRHILCRAVSTCVRQYHTHASLRHVLLALSLTPGLHSARAHGPTFLTDRLLLFQCTHSIDGLNFDRSSCDSLVWSTDAGTYTGHGFRELLAGDNNGAMQRTALERDRATATFSDGLLGRREALKSSLCGEAASSTATPLDAIARRPLASVATRCRPASHPHLPFYLVCATDGHIDLYPFASSECISTFICPRSSPMVEVSYSPDGYTFVTGLQDGSVAGWRCDPAAVASAPDFMYPSLFVPFGIRAVFYCSHSRSFVVAVGVVAEPHRHPNGGGRPASSTARSYTPCEVGELVVLDTALSASEVLVRCALPFVPDFAVPVPSADGVLCISSVGWMAYYDLRQGHLTSVGALPLHLVIHDGALPSSSDASAGARRPQILAPLQRRPPPVLRITAVASSPYDSLVALGTSDGLVFLVRTEVIMTSVREERQRQEREGEDAFVYSSSRDDAHTGAGLPPDPGTFFSGRTHSVLLRAAQVLMGPSRTPHASVEGLVFCPSVLLVGLKDGKIMAVALIPDGVRQMVTKR